MKKKIVYLLIFLCCMNLHSKIVFADELEIASRSAVLMEVSTGEILYEKDSDITLIPASITKIMTLLLIFEALEQNEITLDDEVVTSAYAKSMGGSQVFLEEGEIQTVENLIKCIVIASGNDASVAMAEYIAGSESEFVEKMNERAKMLQMNNTHFEDCCGLTDSDTHVTSAKDVAIMTRELVLNHPEVYQYSGIWMDKIIHQTKKGSSEFYLANTNKLLKTYDGIKGLKTGSTSKAKYCFSGTAIRNNMHLIAVIMASDNYKTRFQEAARLLDFGFQNYYIYTEKDIPSKTCQVKKGKEDKVSVITKTDISCLCSKDMKSSEIEKIIEMPDEMNAPVSKETPIGKITYMYGDKTLGTIELYPEKDVLKATYFDYIKKMKNRFLLKTG